MSWSHVQTASGANNTSGTLAVAFTTTNVSSGNKIIAAVCVGAGSGPVISSVKDGAGNTWTQLQTAAYSTNVLVGLFALDVPAGDVGTMPTLTLTYSGGGGQSAAMVIQEVSGLLAGNTSAMLDGTPGTATGTASPTTAATYASNAANEYLVLLYGDEGNSTTWTQPAGYSGSDGVNGSANDNVAIAYTNSTGGNETGQYTLNQASEYGIIFGAFKLANVSPVITTTSLPNAEIGYAYSATVTATSGTTPYTWSISSGSLPGWASLNSSTGAITGTPTGSPATTSFTVEVTDANSLTGTQALSITTFNPVPATVPTFPAIPGLSTPGASTPADPGAPASAPSSGPVFYPARQAVRAKFQQNPSDPSMPPVGHIYKRRDGSGRTFWSGGAPVKNPTPGPVFFQATSPCRARIPQNRPGGFYNGFGTDSTQASGRVMWSPGAPVRNPVPGPVFFQRRTPVRYALSPPPPRKGRVGSSFGAPVQNPIHGPPAYPLQGPVRERLPQLQPRAGRVYSSTGAPVRNPSPGPVFIQRTTPARAQHLLPPRGRAYSFAVKQVVPPSSGPVFTQRNTALRAQAPSRLRGRMASIWGAPVQNPTPGPAFTQAASPARIRASLPPRGRTGSNPGIRVKTSPGPVLHPQGLVRGRIPQVFTKGRVSFNHGAPVHNPVPGPVFRQADSPARARVAQDAPRGRISFNRGAPVATAVSGPVFVQRAFVRARLPLPRRGICRAIRVYPLQANPAPGPVFIQATSPVRARFPLRPRGRTGSNAGGPVLNPSPGPRVYPLQRPVRAPLPPLHPRAGRIGSGPGAPVANPQQGPPLLPLGQPSGVRVIFAATGRMQSTPVAVVSTPPPPVSGPAFVQKSFVRAQQPLSRRGICRAIRFYGVQANPASGPVFAQATSPVRARFPLPPRGRIGSSQGAPVRNPVPAVAFAQKTSPARIRPSLPLRGRIGSDPGGPVRNPSPVTTGPVFTQRTFIRAQQPLPRRGACRAIRFYPAVANPAPGPVFYPATSPARARFPLPPRGRASGNIGGPYVAPPVTGPRFYLADSPVRARIPQVAPRGRVCSDAGAPVRNPAPGPVFHPAVRPCRAVIPQVFSKGRTSGNPGGLVVNPPAPVYPRHGPVRVHPVLPPRGRTAANAGIPAAIPTPGPKVYPAKGPVQARRPLPPHGRVTLGNKGAAVHNPTRGAVFHPAVRPIRGIIPQNAPRGRTSSNPGGPVENIPFATLKFGSGSPRFQWDTGIPGGQWYTGSPGTTAG